MSLGWHNFLYNSFDPAGFISVDKPPVGLWIQVASVKLFGFHALSVLGPQALEGVAAVALLYHLVQRRFGAAAGLLAALFLALTPVSVAIDRSSNIDSCLVLVLLLAAWALTLAVEKGSLPLLALAMGLVGVGFNVKMLAAFVVLPTFALVYFAGAPLTVAPPSSRRGGGAGRGVGELGACHDFTRRIAVRTPATNRNSMLGSRSAPRCGPILGSSEFGRFHRLDERPGRTSQTAGGADRAAAQGPRRGFSPLRAGAAGALRLTDGQLAGQVGWLLPLALAGLALGVAGSRSRVVVSALAVLLWVSWLVTAWSTATRRLLSLLLSRHDGAAARGVAGMVCEPVSRCRGARHAVLLPIDSPDGGVAGPHRRERPGVEGQRVPSAPRVSHRRRAGLGGRAPGASPGFDPLRRSVRGLV
jgi:hypothetical protein